MADLQEHNSSYLLFDMQCDCQRQPHKGCIWQEA